MIPVTCIDTCTCVLHVSHVLYIDRGSSQTLDYLYVWHNSFIRVTWLTHVCNITHMCDRNHSDVWHNSYDRNWLTRAMSHIWVSHVTHINDSCHTPKCFNMLERPSSYESCHTNKVIFIILLCDTTLAYASQKRPNVVPIVCMKVDQRLRIQCMRQQISISKTSTFRRHVFRLKFPDLNFVGSIKSEIGGHVLCFLTC